MVIQNLKKYMKQQLMTPKLEVQTQTLSVTTGWNASQWARFFEINGVHIDTACYIKLKAELVPTSGVAHKIALLHLGALHQEHTPCQYHHVRAYAHKLGLLHTPSIEAVCMFRKTHRYVDILTTFGASNIIAFYPSSSENVPQLQLIIGHAFNRDFLLATPLHQHSPLSPANRILYAG